MMEEIIETLPFPVFFMIFWLVITGIISIIGGWFSLAKRFPLVKELKNSQKTFFMQSMGLGYLTSYGSCINVSFFVEGIKFSPIFLFRFFHRPIFIDWTDIKKHSTSNFIFKKSVFFLNDKRIVLFGGSARYLQDQLEVRPVSF